MGEVSRGASAEAITALRTVTYAEARNDASLVLGEQCSICRMEWEEDDELRLLPCKHAEHAECLDQWLAVNKKCPVCAKEVLMPAAPAGTCAPCCVSTPPAAPIPTEPPCLPVASPTPVTSSA